MADSCRKMQAKCQQSGSMMATADDTESASDAPTSDRKGAMLFAGGVGLPPSPTDHPLTGFHCIVAGGRACTPPDALPPPGVLYKHYPQQPRDVGPAPASTCTHCIIHISAFYPRPYMEPLTDNSMDHHCSYLPFWTIGSGCDNY